MSRPATEFSSTPSSPAAVEAFPFGQDGGDDLPIKPDIFREGPRDPVKPGDQPQDPQGQGKDPSAEGQTGGTQPPKSIGRLS